MRDRGVSVIIYAVMMCILFLMVFVAWYRNYFYSSIKDAEAEHMEEIFREFGKLQFALSRLHSVGDTVTVSFKMAPQFPVMVLAPNRSSALWVENGWSLSGRISARENGQGKWWFDARWDKRVVITVHNPDPEPLENYQLRLTIPRLRGMREDFKDLRFTEKYGENLLPYWIETLTLDNLVVGYHMDEETGRLTFDFSGNGFDGEIFGDANWVEEGMRNGALEFDGETGRVQIYDADALRNLTKNFTISMWIRIYDNTKRQRFFTNGRGGVSGWGIGQNEDGYVWFAKCGVADLYSNVSLSTDNWYHLAIVVDSNYNPKLYINGSLAYDFNDTQPISPNTNLGAIQIGCDVDSAGNFLNFFDGTIDELCIFNEALTEENIRALYENREQWKALVWVRIPYLPAGGSENIWMYYDNPSAADEGDPNETFFFWDYFWRDPNSSSRWEVYRYQGDVFTEFAWEIGEPGILWLTKAVDSRGAAAFFKQPSYPFWVEFDYKAENVTGADGLAFAFDKRIDNYRKYGACASGGSLGLAALNPDLNTKVLSVGHAIEFDSYANSFDPSPNHVALVRTLEESDPVTHENYENDARTEDSLWHKVKIIIKQNYIQVELDGETVLAHNFENLSPPDDSYAGFCAGTGFYMNAHLIKRVRVGRYCSTIPSADILVDTIEAGPPRCGRICFEAGNLLYPKQIWIYEDVAVLMQQDSTVLMRSEPLTFKAENAGETIEITYTEIWFRGSTPKSASTGRVSLILSLENTSVQKFSYRASETASLIFRSNYFLAWQKYVEKVRNQLIQLGYSANQVRIEHVPFGWKISLTGKPINYTHKVYLVSVRKW